MKTKSLVSLSLLALTALSATASTKEDLMIWPFSLEYSGNLTNVTHNGKWAVASPRAGESFNKLQLIDAMQGKIFTKTISKVLNVNGSELDYDPLAPITTGAVSEDGKILAGTYLGIPGYWQDDVWYVLDFPNKRGQIYSGYTDVTITNMREGGKYILGFAFNSAYDIKPMLWIDHKLVTPEGLPTCDWKGNALEGGTLSDERPARANMRFIDITSDGRYLLGGMSTNHPGWGCCYFVYDFQKKDFKFIGLTELNELIASGEYFEETECMGDMMPTLSADGKYVVGNVNLCKNNGSPYPTELKMPYIYTIATDKLEILDNQANDGMGICGISDSKELVGMTSIDAPARSVIFLRNGVWYTLESILEQVYDTNYNVATGYSDLSGSPFGISADGHTIVAMIPGSTTYCYSVNLEDQSFFEAADQVNMLRNYDVLPSKGSSIAVFNNFTIRFDRAVDFNGKKATIKDSKGEVVATSYSVEQPNGINDERFKQVNFPETKLKGGETYTVNLPYGMFLMKGTENMLSQDIIFKYDGREEKPVALVDAYPKDNSGVQELGVNSMIMLNFDGTIQPANKAEGYLYQEGSDVALSSLNLAADGNTLLVYPSVTRKLKKNTNYTVVIPEGAVVDITGYCPNEEIVLHYEGTYSLSQGENDVILFQDDFSEPGTSLANWMLYEGDHFKPSSTMESWGFDADNTPWNFSIRDAGEYDYAACSHSNYESPGKSDDWMVTPQLNIRNPFFFLDFDAQSFKKGSTDILKVLVWPYDENITNLDKAMVEKMRSEATVIFERALDPGLNEETLAYEWKHFQLPLAEFAGKKVYIAFVNENEQQSAVFVDNVKVEFFGNFQAGVQDEEYVVKQPNHEVSGYVSIINDVNYDSFRAELTTPAGFKSTLEKDGLDLKKGDVYNFTFPDKMPLVEGEPNYYTLTVYMGGEDQSAHGTVYNLMFQPEKRVVVEEGTGTWCGNCPRGILALEDLEKKFGENVIPISIHNNDIMAMENYISFMGFYQFPNGRVNRLETFLMPTVTNQETGKQSFTSASGKETFHDVVISELEQPAVAQIDIKKAALNFGNNMEVDAEVKFALSAKDVNYNILTVVLEDNVMALQSNYLAGESDPLYGEWGLGGAYDAAHAFFNFVDVARGIGGPSFHGDSGYVPKDVEVNTPYSANIRFRAPTTINNNVNLKIVTMLINAQTGRVVNAARFDKVDLSGVDAITAGDEGFKFSVANGEILANGSADGVCVFTLDGRRVANSNLGNGLYIARAIKGDKTATAKIMIKR